MSPGSYSIVLSISEDTFSSYQKISAALLRARNPLLWIVTREKARVESYLFEAAAGLTRYRF